MKKLLAVVGAVTLVAGATVAGMLYLKKKGIIYCEDEDENLEDIDVRMTEDELNIPVSEDTADTVDKEERSAL